MLPPSRMGTSRGEIRNFGSDQSRVSRLPPDWCVELCTLYTRRLPSRSYLSSRSAGAMSSNVVTLHVSSGMWNSPRTWSTYCCSRSTSHRGSSRGFASTFFRCTFPILPTPEMYCPFICRGASIFVRPGVPCCNTPLLFLLASLP